MADGPSRSVVIFGDGFLPHVAAQHSNLHSLASDGCCGFLALRSPAAASDGNRSAEALIQLLDLYDADKEGKSFQTVSERFMGMNAALVTNSEQAVAVGSKAGFVVSRFQDLHEGIGAEDMPSKFLGMVGVGDSAGGKPFDLLFLHLVADNDLEKSPAISTEWMDSLVGKLKNAPAKNLLLVLILGYGNALSEVEIPEFIDQQLRQLRPRQSYSIKGGKPVEDISKDCSLLAVFHQKAVTRRDHCTCLQLEEFRQKCGNLTILADRFLHEVAFKLWKAPKYGA
ncbi:uncharacterized protein LOC9633512 isoform X1 [Selaginella moellendorffii]|uniref:uncharacterized protein LOC9633512 isoform X1 n=1 Tax=Selaginella moellendorffii TaxID=88036 RepID=UPI000D1C8398|nr:uncharacterized protein LOC9633512 isoform X1 [Selaginella moellendorffii]|eukprot:XP_024531427.1 uncharacterized protein LOC9633512 isoform X1 [Selaginella moellendorffii]